MPATYRKLAAIGGEIRAVGNAQENGKVVYVMASAKPKTAKKKQLWKRLLLELPFMVRRGGGAMCFVASGVGNQLVVVWGGGCLQFLVHNFHVDASKVFGIPEDKLCEVGMQYHL